MHSNPVPKENQMNNPILCMAAFLLLLSACHKAEDATPDNVPVKEAVTTATTDFTRYTITKGAHYATNNVYQPLETSELKFIVKFDSTAIYTSLTQGNQYDINKLYGFSDNNMKHHSYSARFGWSWNHEALRLYGYVYNNGVVASKELAVIPIGKEVSCSIKVTNHTYEFFINDVRKGTLDRYATTSKAVGYRLYPYFGGDETAPHNVDIWIKNR